MAISDWLWCGFVAMAVGSAILLVMGWNRRTRDEENHYLLHLFGTLTVTASYLAMALEYPLCSSGFFGPGAVRFE